MKADELKDVLAKHLAWLRSEAGGARANLTGANLRDADLGGANLGGADLRGADLGARSIVPASGAFEAWKKLSKGHVAHLHIPADAQRLSALPSRKCRASRVKVLAIYDSFGASCVGPVAGTYDRNTTYTVGQTVEPDRFDDDVRVECSNGIHFFLTRQEAEEYV